MINFITKLGAPLLLIAILGGCGGTDKAELINSYSESLDRLAPRENKALQNLAILSEAKTADDFISDLSSQVIPDLEAVKIKLAAIKVDDEELAEVHQYHIKALDAYLEGANSAIEAVLKDDRAEMARSGSSAALGDRMLVESKKVLSALKEKYEIK